MSIKFIPTEIDNLQSETTAVNSINENFQAVADLLDENLSRDGTAPNFMSNNLDMNSQRILNLPQAINPTDPIRLMDLPALVGVGDGGGDIVVQGPPGNFITGRMFWDANIAGTPRLQILPHLDKPEPAIGTADNPGGYRNASIRYWDTWDTTPGSGTRVYFNNTFFTTQDPEDVIAKKSNYLAAFIAYSKVPSGEGYNKLGQVSDVIRTNRGSGYATAPTWSVTGGGGTGANGTTTINDAGEVIDFQIVSGGSGYATAPTIVLSGGGGSGAAATAEINGKNFWPQQVGPLSARAVIADGNLSGKAETAVFLAGHESSLADGKIIVIQAIIEGHGADFGWNRQLEPDGEDPSSKPAAYPACLFRGNNAGETLGNQAFSIKPGRKFALQEGFAPCGFYHIYCADPNAVWLGNRDDGYNAVEGDGLSTEARPGSLLRQWEVSALDGWGRIGLGTDEPQYSIDDQRTYAGDIPEWSASALDVAAQATDGRVVHRIRSKALNDDGEEFEFARQEVYVEDASEGTEDASWRIKTALAGTLADRLVVNGTWGRNTSGQRTGSLSVTQKAAITAASDVATIKAALLLDFA